jgi:hypothetical protein
MSDHGLEEHWRIMTVRYASHINGRDKLWGAKEELKNSLVLIS